ncbi:vWA domain-containing protein [Aquabacter spiritensis]|uniref:Uncharacterized protein YegL n=1 Tax=Aquabacter spiritensis TaxID=933073 RepID=A0A4R3M196_9HYPH|nr:VWA domain-containing protein [Aquabacter spiritensis]TCT06881.1 uncharacterized protein YegL [Aquabacter spiritensis]
MSAIVRDESFGSDEENFAERVLCTLLIDGSLSMSNDSKIDQLNAALHLFKSELMADPLASISVRLNIIRFGGLNGKDTAHVVTDWTEAREFTPPTVTAAGQTPLGRGLSLAMESIAEEKASLRAIGISMKRPWLFILTDGQPNDPWEAAAAQCREGEKSGKFIVWPIGIGQDANFDVLRRMSSRNFALEVGEAKFRELFQWLSDSMKSVSNSRAGEVLALPSPTDIFKVHA